METSTASPNRARVTAIVVVIVAFIAGLLVGVAGDHVYLIHNRQLNSRRAMGNMAKHLLDRLDRDLSLTPQQHEQVRRIIDAHHQKIESIAAATRPQIGQELSQASREIEAVLTPEQRRKFATVRMRVHGGPRFHLPGHAPF